MNLISRLIFVGVAFVINSADAKTFTIDEDTSSVHSLDEESGDFQTLKHISEIVNWPENGTVFVTEPHTVIYVPEPNFCGSDSLSYRVEPGPSDDDSIDPPTPPISIMSTFGSFPSTYTETVSYNVRCINDPVLLSISGLLNLQSGSSKTIHFYASDVDSSNFSVALQGSTNDSVLHADNLQLTQVSQIYYENGKYIAQWKLQVEAPSDTAGHTTIQLRTSDGEGLSKHYSIDVSLRRPKRTIFIHTDLLGSPVAETTSSEDN
ncbi:Ig-like domain-containing protein [Pseudoalteromonas piscicida]|uniref:Cadherin domain-containing protein n=1 Tax=Pseudoalteromonas piscicida TaxID=43662 RepID=A0A2A5JMW9_PSEO7|nr:Ig-like domain-containing protein [Pseudoalteromonas piscicida]PCK30775.1 hypothetical protein CEX98_16015 [Pseudoalteromonas piscicida]